MRILRNKNIKGLSLIEILIVITIFAVIGLLSTRSVFLTLRGAKKSESTIKIRESLNFAFAVIERQLRNAESVTCPNSPTTSLSYVSIEGVSTSFSCTTVGTDKYIASGSARLTSNDIYVSTCSITCTQSSVNTPPKVDIVVEASDNNTSDVEEGIVSMQTQVILRNY